MKTTKLVYDILQIKSDAITQNHSRICARYIYISKMFRVF